MPRLSRLVGAGRGVYYDSVLGYGAGMRSRSRERKRIFGKFFCFPIEFS